MTLAEDLLPDLEEIRGIPDGDLGLRPFTVSVLVRTWSGARVGLGTKTDVTTVLTNDQGKARVRARSLTAKDVVASGGLYSADDWRIGPMTPPFPGGGVNQSTTNPPVSGAQTEVFYRIDGPGMAGVWFKRKADERDSALRHMVIVERTATTP